MDAHVGEARDGKRDALLEDSPKGRHQAEEKKEDGAEKTERPERHHRDPRDMHPTGTTEQRSENN